MTGEATDARAEIKGRVQDELVGGFFDEDLVAGREERGHGEVVGERGACGFDHALGRDALEVCDGFE